VPAELEGIVEKIARHAYRVTDDDYARLRELGYSEDQLFAVTLSAATGAAWARLQRGLAVLQAAPAPSRDLDEVPDGLLVNQQFAAPKA
jgi:alkylhydroperoxidase family enzyme